VIKIAQRYRPFSHLIGAKCLIPQSQWIVQAYPALIRLIKDKKLIEIFLSVKGPVDGFTLLSDLEDDVVRVFGKGKEGYFGFKIAHVEKKMILEFERGTGITCTLDNKKMALKKGERIEILVEDRALKKNDSERLFLGKTKKLLWEQVISRRDLAEIFPVVFLLGQKVQSNSSYLAIEDFQTELLGGFEDILVPLRKDGRYQGLSIDEISKDTSSLTRLSRFQKSIRDLFILENDGIVILPRLLKEFHAGKMLNVRLKKCILDMEWSKKKLRKIHIMGTSNANILFNLPKEISSFRLKMHRREKGSIIYRDEKFQIKKGERYFLDKFKK